MNSWQDERKRTAEADASGLLLEAERKLAEMLDAVAFGKMLDSFDLNKAVEAINGLLEGIRKKAEFAIKNDVQPGIYGKQPCPELFEAARDSVLRLVSCPDSSELEAMAQVLKACRYALCLSKIQAEYTAFVEGVCCGIQDGYHEARRMVGKTGTRVKKEKVAAREAKEAAAKNEGARKTYSVRALIAACRKYERKLADQKEDSRFEVVKETIKEIRKDGYFFEVKPRNFCYRIYPKWVRLGRPSTVADYNGAERDYKRKIRQ